MLIHMIPEPSVALLAKLMVCPKESRASASQIRAHPVTLAWRWTLGDENVTETDLQDPLSIIGLLSGIKFIRTPETVLKALTALCNLMNEEKFNSNHTARVAVFMESRGPATLMKFCQELFKKGNSGRITERKEALIWNLSVKLLVQVFSELISSPEYFQYQRMIRSSGISDFLSFVPENQEEMHDLMALLGCLCRDCPTMQHRFKGSATSALKSWIGSVLSGKSGATGAILAANLIPALPPDEAATITELLPDELCLDAFDLIPPHRRSTYASVILNQCLKTLKGKKSPAQTRHAIKLMACVLRNHHEIRKLAGIYGICSRVLLGNFYEPSTWYFKCKTCWGDKLGIGACIQCASVCHQGHELVLQRSFSGFFCDCRDKEDQICKFAHNTEIQKLIHAQFQLQKAPVIMDFQKPEPAFKSEDIDITGRRIICKNDEGARFTITTESPLGVLSNVSEKPTRTVCYFEMEVLGGGVVDGINVGFCTSNKIDNSKLPGVQIDFSIAFYLNDGDIAYKEDRKEVIQRYAGICGTGQVIGCGLTDSGQVYFTCDGVMLPLVEKFNLFNAAKQSDNNSVKIYPIVCMEGAGTAVHLNYGKYPFTFSPHQEKPQKRKIWKWISPQTIADIQAEIQNLEFLDDETARNTEIVCNALNF